MNIKVLNADITMFQEHINLSQPVRQILRTCGTRLSSLLKLHYNAQGRRNSYSCGKLAGEL